MAKVICNVRDCIHRSKRKLKKYQTKDGKPCYGCTLEFINIREVYDIDGNIEAVGGKENTVVCSYYEFEE